MRTAQIGELTGPVKTWNPSRTPEAEFDYIDLSAVDNIRKVITTTTRTIGADAPSRARQLVTAGDVLVSTVRPNLNAVAVVPPELDGATASTGFTVLRPAAQLNGRYLFHWLRSPTFVADMARKATGASYPAVSDRIIKESTLPAPSLDKQHRIAAILDHADTLRVERRRALAHLDALPQAMFRGLLGTGAHRRVPLAEIADVSSGITKGRRTTASTRAVPYLAVANVQAGHLALDNVKTIDATDAEVQRYALQPGDLVLTEGGDPDKLGRGTLWRGEIAECIHQNHIFRVRLKPGAGLRAEILEAFLGSWDARSYFLRSAKQTTGIASINKTQLAALPVPLPPLDLQKEFYQRLAAFRTHASAAAQHWRSLDAAFASLQARAFKGEL